MGALNEIDIFSCLTENLRLAAQHARDLAHKPAQGPTYWNFREEMLLVEGACRQAAAWREDSRWLNIGMVIAQALDRTGKWLRGYKTEHGGRIFTARDMYLKLAESLEAIGKVVEQTKTGSTGRVGMILPDIANVSRTEGRAVQVRLPPSFLQRPSGLILPA